MSRPLHLLAAGDAQLAGLAGGGADVVIEGRDGDGAGRGAHDLGALGIVRSHDRVMIEKVEVGVGHRALDELESVGGERRLLRRREPAGVADRHLAIFQIDAAPIAVAAVAPGQHLAVPVERRFHRREHVAEGAEANTIAGRFHFRCSHAGDPFSSKTCRRFRPLRHPRADRIPPGGPLGMLVDGRLNVPPMMPATRGFRSARLGASCRHGTGRPKDNPVRPWHDGGSARLRAGRERGEAWQ